MLKEIVKIQMNPSKNKVREAHSSGHLHLGVGIQSYALGWRLDVSLWDTQTYKIRATLVGKLKKPPPVTLVSVIEKVQWIFSCWQLG